MAITESRISQSLRQTADGQFFRRVFDLTWTDWNNGTFDAFYWVGQSLAQDATFPSNEWTASLRVSDINLTPTNSQTNIKVEVLYSSNFTGTTTKKRANEAGSFEIEFDFGTQVEYVENELYPQMWGDAVARSGDPNRAVDFKNWRSFAKDNNIITSLDSAAPALQVYSPTGAFRASAYSDTLLWKKVRDSVGRINKGTDFLLYVIYLATAVKGWKLELAGLSDQYEWLCINCPISQVRQDVWRYDFMFLYKQTHMVNWNSQYRDPTSSNPVIAVNSLAYDDYDFKSLFDELLGNNNKPERISGTR